MRQDVVFRRRRRRALLAAGGVVAVAAAVAVPIAASGGDDGRAPARAATTTVVAAQAARPQLPRGGRRLFPERRVVAYYGNPAARGLGALGIGSLRGMTRRLEKAAAPYARKTRPVLPAMELITSIATAAPGADGLYRTQVGPALIDRYLRAARRAQALLILDIQPGRAPFGHEIERLARWLREPDVGLALDPEWHVGAGQVPGQVIGGMDADAVNAAASYLGKMVRKRDLPEKLLLVHRFTDDMISRAERLRQFPGVQTVVNVDGFGGRAIKVGKYESFVKSTPRMRRGFKLFYEEDTGLMTPAQVMALSPRPDVIVYE